MRHLHYATHRSNVTPPRRLPGWTELVEAVATNHEQNTEAMEIRKKYDFGKPHISLSLIFQKKKKRNVFISTHQTCLRQSEVILDSNCIQSSAMLVIARFDQWIRFCLHQSDERRPASLECTSIIQQTMSKARTKKEGD